MIKAVIDMGTNTFNLLIARTDENSFEPLLSIKEGVALGMGGINKNIIAEDAWMRAFVCLDNFKRYCDKWEVENLVVVGTSSIRGATNATKFIKQVDEFLNTKTIIVDGRKEAELVYHGVCWSHQFTDSALIIDIGGGSTEFICADKSGIIKLESFEIGVSRVFQKFEFSNPMTQEQVEIVEDFFEQNAGDFIDSLDCKTLIGASGSFESLYELIYKLPFPKEIELIDLDLALLMKHLDKMIFSTVEEREENQYIIPIRRKMMHVTSVKIRWVINKMKANKVVISPCSIKEGALMYYPIK